MPILQQVHSLLTRDGRLRVDFQWTADRFVQRVYLDDAEVGRSIEGGEQEPWPPSPPIQQLLPQEIDGSSAILGVGAAGRGHWSISVELDGEGAINFDLACRCKDQAEFLGSTYRLDDSVMVESADSSASVTGDTTTIRAPQQRSETHRWQYRLSAAAN
jgi:hypothetical protein